MITLCPICCRPLKKGEVAVVRSDSGAHPFTVVTSDGGALGEHKSCFDSDPPIPQTLFENYEPANAV